jgi:hypothetical protein
MELLRVDGLSAKLPVSYLIESPYSQLFLFMALLVLQRDTFGAQPRKPWSSARVMGTKDAREYNNAMV